MDLKNKFNVDPEIEAPALKALLDYAKDGIVAVYGDSEQLKKKASMQEIEDYLNQVIEEYVQLVRDKDLIIIEALLLGYDYYKDEIIDEIREDLKK